MAYWWMVCCCVESIRITKWQLINVKIAKINVPPLWKWEREDWQQKGIAHASHVFDKGKNYIRDQLTQLQRDYDRKKPFILTRILCMCGHSISFHLPFTFWPLYYCSSHSHTIPASAYMFLHASVHFYLCKLKKCACAAYK